MERLVVKGSKKLNGTVIVPKAKNSILPMMAAALLCEGESRICEVPPLADVATSIRLVQALGGRAALDGDTLCIQGAAQLSGSVPQELSAAMRSSVYYIVPMLARSGSATIAFPGGCRLGERPIDLHLAGLEAMGAEVSLQDGVVHCTAKQLHGTAFCLSFPSVGATETLMMAACVAKGKTVLCGCAKEPEIADLARFLNSCGAKISGAGGSCITVTGGQSLTGCCYTPIPDRITAATVLCAVAACGGDVTLRGAVYEHLLAIVHLLEDAGGKFVRPESGVIRMTMHTPMRAQAISTGVYPAFPTDAGPLFAAALLTAQGTGSVTETIFEHRFACADEFTKLGAAAQVQQRTLTIEGGKALVGTQLVAQDLRGGAALVIAALAAQGVSEISGTGYIERGYADIAALFAALGAEIAKEM